MHGLFDKILKKIFYNSCLKYRRIARSRNYDLERNVEYQIFDWYIGNSTKQMTRFNRSGNDASRKNQLSLRTTRLTRTDCLICHYIWLSTFRTMKLNWLWQEKSKYRNNSTLQRDDLKTHEDAVVFIIGWNCVRSKWWLVHLSSTRRYRCFVLLIHF